MSSAKGSSDVPVLNISLFQESTDACLLVDAQTHRLLDVNSSAQRLTGFDRTTLLSMQVVDLLRGEGDGLDQMAAPLPVTGSFHSREGYWLRRRQGAPLPVNVSVSQLTMLPRPCGLVTVRDISERIRAQEELRRREARQSDAQKLESLVRMAAGVAHDFNNLLTIILSEASLASDSLPVDSPVRRRITDAVAATHQAADLCQQILSFTGKGVFTVQSLQLSTLVREMQPLLHGITGPKITLTCNLTEPLPEVRGSDKQLRQVLLSLVNNAVEALENGVGEITIATGVVHADRAYLAETVLDENLAGGEYVSLEVTDTGRGMDADIQSRIFEPFFSTKRLGRGLGLAAVLGIVRGHGGAIRVLSQPGQGTSMVVLLRAAGPLAAPAAPLSLFPKAEQERTILVVDDEEGVRKVAQTILELGGFRVRAMAGGREALAFLRAHPGEIDAVLLDLTMPNFDGEQTLRELDQLCPGLPVLLMSGYHEQDVATRFFGRSLAGVLPKPFGPRELLQRLQAIWPTA